jgi:hypothetical protein
MLLTEIIQCLGNQSFVLTKLNATFQYNRLFGVQVNFFTHTQTGQAYGWFGAQKLNLGCFQILNGFSSHIPRDSNSLSLCYHWSNLWTKSTVNPQYTNFYDCQKFLNIKSVTIPNM